MKVKVITLGCKVNTYESQYIIEKFLEKGYEITNSKADIYVINTCSVTNQSDAKSRKVINKVIRENSDAVIVVMGCMIESHKDYQNEKVSIILGNKDKAKVVSLVSEYLKMHEKKKILYDDFDSKFEDMFIKNMSSRTRAFIKIQDGCENFCSYCIIPYTRGKQRSKKKEVVLEEVNTLVNNNYKEIVLTGIHTGHYGSDIKTTFPELLEEILKIEKLKRVRISSIEITELNDEFLRVLKSSFKIANQIHIPLQSGSDTILKLMNRKYLTNYFYDKINMIRKIRPDISITTDLIVGFPGESEELFLETYEFIKKIKFTKVHVFPYSIREGTKASLMPNQVPENIKKERVRKIIELSNQLESEYLDKFIGQEVLVLIEESDEIASVGHTSNYLKVKVLEKIESNKEVLVKINSKCENTLIGEVINEGN